VTPDAILDRLDEQQREVALAVQGAVCVLAGAGTGKTRAITHRIAYGVAVGVYDPRRVMAVTFTTKAAGEMRTRLRGLGAEVQARTFHSAALAQLAHFWPRLAGGRMPEVLPTKARTIADAALQLRLKVDTAQLRDLAAEVEWRKARALTLEQYAAGAHGRALPGGMPVSTMVELHETYERLKDDRRQIDFEDVILATTGMLEREPIAADTVRGQYRHLTVDEYQDVSPLQQRLLDAWLGGREEVCVVGDPSQTVFAFAGANARSLPEFIGRHPDATVVRLEQSHRSTAQVVGAANRLMRGRDAIHLRAERTGPEVEVSMHPSDAAEARAVAERCRALVARGERASDMAVLVRFHAQSAGIEQALADAGLSVRLAGSQRFFELPAVRQAMLMLQQTPDDGRPLFQAVIDVVHPIGYSHEPPATQGEERARWDALHALVTLAEEAPAGATAAGFAGELARRAATDHEPGVEAVTIATLHAAKGLEWEHVHMVGLSEGLLPISYATSLDAIDEERRLCYVGITRARTTLHLSHAAASGRMPRTPSRFLAELDSRTAGAASTARR